MTTPTNKSPDEITARIVEAANIVINAVHSRAGNIPLRLFGSAAVAIKCPAHLYLWRELARTEIRDIDLVTLPKYRPKIRAALQQEDFLEDNANVLSNAQYGRLYFYREDLKPFTFELIPNPLIFHHKLDVADQLLAEPLTLPLADLLISKLQWETIAKTPSQLIDLAVIFAEHEVSVDESVGIAAKRVLYMARRDWCLWRTIRKNLHELSKFVSENVHLDGTRNQILARVNTLDSLLHPLSDTTLRWKLEGFAHRVWPKLRCGYPVEEPDEDPWRTWEREHK